MAPASEYATTGSGKLKIKGVQGGRVEKKKKKKKKDKDSVKEKPTEGEEEYPAENQKDGQTESMAEKRRSGSRDLRDEEEEEEEGQETYGKTEAERRYNEARRKRVCFGSTRDSYTGGIR